MAESNFEITPTDSFRYKQRIVAFNVTVGDSGYVSALIDDDMIIDGYTLVSISVHYNSTTVLNTTASASIFGGTQLFIQIRGGSGTNVTGVVNCFYIKNDVIDLL